MPYISFLVESVSLKKFITPVQFGAIIGHKQKQWYNLACVDSQVRPTIANIPERINCDCYDTNVFTNGLLSNNKMN